MKGFRGFPTLAFMDADGEVLTSNVERSVKGFASVAAALASAAELGKAEKAGKLDAEGSAKLILAELDLGKLDFAAASKRVAGLPAGVSAESKKTLDGRLLDLEVASIFTRHQEAAAPKQQKAMAALRPADGKQPTPEQRDAARAAMEEISNGVQDAVVAELLPLVEKGKIPADKTAARFWFTLWQHADRHKDEAMSKRAKSELEALAARDPKQKPMIDRMLNPRASGSIPATPLRGPEEKPADKPAGKADGAKAKTSGG